ncbi:hypothetical protein W97_05005 [Coniosporium apollinis CBS 100218]|uniref:Heterokaryon incompatibility domain-containing protein n=1 Tax=Coniosporium apollinis (strain CBS 100218) TaxID=1168221 RepID=R7YVS8_CONA1|nr:uncharacterized protein W97_05005 [Coniosporium apollinis CBS 100218]EON65766.1 hypothetical protein W97_05005 [Coniosporium apollinis CBS 100218]
MSKRQAGQLPQGLVAADASAAKRARVEDVPCKTRKRTAAMRSEHAMILRSQHRSQSNSRGPPQQRYGELGRTAATANTNASGDAHAPSDRCMTSSTRVPSHASNRRILRSALYKPLDPSRREIRLITLAGGEFSDDIRCSLSAVSLDNEPVYEALSYVWGDPDVMLPMTLQGGLHQVTTNLEAALRHLRYHDRPRVLWVDAVCINQKDLLERQKQVLLMGDVFRTASVVLCWLGEESEDSALAFDAFETWPKDSEIHWDPDETPGIDPRTSGIEYANAVWRLSRRRYFKRLWIVQEMILGKSHQLICGNRQSSTDELLRIVKCVVAHRTTCMCMNRHHRKEFSFAALGGLAMSAKALTFRRTGELDKAEILHLLATFRAHRCSDPRDHIYGLLSIASDTPHVVPGYNTPVPLVYEQFTVDNIKTHQNLDVLSQVLPSSTVLSTRIPTGLPTWVPDWSATLVHRGISTNAYNRFVNIREYNSSVGSTANVRQPGRGRLAVRGVPLGTIARLGSAVVEDMSKNDVVEFIESGMHFAMLETLPNRSYPGGLDFAHSSATGMSDFPAVSNNAAYDPRVSMAACAASQTTYCDALWMTFCGSIVPDFFKSASESNVIISTSTTEPWWNHSFYNTRWEYWKMPVDELLPLGLSRERAMLERQAFVSRLGSTMYMRRLFMSDAQHEWLGSAPVDAEVGDTIAILAGGKVPYILRQKEVNGERVFHFIGDAYVHGIMNGEGMALGEMEEIVLV